MEVSYCEPEQGTFLGEDDEAEKERPIESLINSVKNTDKHMEEMTMRPNENNRSYVFQTDDLFVIAGFVANDGQSFETVLKFDEVKYDEDSLSNEEMSEVLQQKELIDNDEVEKERQIESLMDYVKSKNLLMEEMTVRPNETKRSYVFLD